MKTESNLFPNPNVVFMVFSLVCVQNGELDGMAINFAHLIPSANT